MLDTEAAHRVWLRCNKHFIQGRRQLNVLHLMLNLQHGEDHLEFAEDVSQVY